MGDMDGDVDTEDGDGGIWVGMRCGDGDEVWRWGRGWG